MKKDKFIDKVFFVVFLVIISAIQFILFYNQALNAGSQTYFKSDILAYMQDAQGIDSGYNYPYRLFFWLTALLSQILPIEIAIAVVITALNALSIVAVKYFFDVLIFEDEIEFFLSKRIVVTILIFACFFLSMVSDFGVLHLPHKYNNYLGIFTGNPWHNATYLATRPFAIVTFFTFIKLLKTYEKKADIKDLIIFGISLFLTTFTKPSFSLVFISTAGLIMAFRLLKSKFKNIKETLILTCAFVPTFIDMLRQYGGVFTSSDPSAETGIGFCFFDVWKLSNIYIPEAVVYANLFGIICLIVFYKDIKYDTVFRFGIILFGVSFLEAGLLCEKGFRFQDFNFCWGYMHGIFFLEVVALLKLIQASFNKTKKWYWLLLCYGTFIVQLVSGVYYFIRVFNGASYE